MSPLLASSRPILIVSAATALPMKGLASGAAAIAAAPSSARRRGTASPDLVADMYPPVCHCDSVTAYLFCRGLASACVSQEGIVRHGLNRPEGAMRDPVRAGRGAGVIGERIKRKIYDLPRIGRDVAGGSVHQVAVKHQHSAWLAGRCDDAALAHQPFDGCIVQRP